MTKRMTADAFLRSLSNHFTVYHKPDSPEEDQWLESMHGILAPYEPEVLAAAADRILMTRKERRFPLPAEIRAACDAVTADERRAALPIDGDNRRTWSHHKDRDADAWIHSEMGRTAAREGWVLGLHQFIRENGRMPDGNERKHWRTQVRAVDGSGIAWTHETCTEIEWIKRSARAATEAYDTLARTPGTPLWRPLMAFAQTLEAKERELAERVLGKP